MNLDKHLFGESGIYILEGGIETGGHEYGSKQLLVSKGNAGCEFTIKAGSTLYIFGGEPFPEDRLIDWNFVSSSKALIEIAKQKWIDRQFDPIIGDDNEFIPYPSTKL